MFESARLDDRHQFDEFECGKAAFNSWLRRVAQRADSSGIAHVYVGTPIGKQKVCAYYALCPTEVIRNDAGMNL